MEHYGIWSLIPPVAAILLAIKTKQVYLSLIVGIWGGWVVISGGNVFTGTMNTIQGLVDVFKDDGNTRTILFSGLIGALLLFIQKSGGVNGFIAWLEKRINNYGEDGGKIRVQLMAWVTSVAIFVESNISVLTVGALYRPVFDKLKISREKLAYITDSGSSPSCIIIPFNAWGAFIMGLLMEQGFDRPFSTLVQSIPYNIYPLLALIIVPLIIIFKKDVGPMKRAEERTRNGEVLWPDAKPMISDEVTDTAVKEGVTPRAINMLLPIVTMVVAMPMVLYWTGFQAVETNASFVEIIGAGSGSTAVLTAVVVAILISMFIYKIQGIFGIREMADLTIKGVSEMIPLAVLMLLAFAISGVCKELNAGNFIAEVTSAWLSPGLLPFMLFLISGFIAFSTGTSWGTFGIMIAISIPMVNQIGGDPIMVIAAILGGGVFGDHCSPISDTTIISSMAAATDHIDHVKTQMPYALTIGAITALFYLVMGLT